MITFVVKTTEFKVERSVLLESKLVAKDSLLAVLAAAEDSDKVEIKEKEDIIQLIIDCYTTHWVDVLSEYNKRATILHKDVYAVYNKMATYYGIIKITQPIKDPMPILRKMKPVGEESEHPISNHISSYVYGVNVLREFIGVPVVSRDYYLAVSCFDSDYHFRDIKNGIIKDIEARSPYGTEAKFEDDKLNIYDYERFSGYELSDSFTVDEKNKTLTDFRGYVYHLTEYASYEKRMDNQYLDNSVVYKNNRYQCCQLEAVISRRGHLMDDFIYNKKGGKQLIEIGYLPVIE